MNPVTHLIEVHDLTPAQIAADWGCTDTFVSHVKNGNKPLPLVKALRTFRARRIKIGPLVGKSTADIKALEAVLDPVKAA